MFVRHSVHVDERFGDCAQALVAGHGSWFPRMLDEVTENDSRHLAEVGLPLAGVTVKKQVRVEIEEPAVDAARVSFSWRPTFPSQLFPTFNGKLELAPVDPAVTRVTVSGTYAPPLGAVGRMLDQALMHRAAEATVKDLAERIAGRLRLAVEHESVGP